MISDEQNRLGRPLPINTLLVLNSLKELPRSDTHQLAASVNLPETIVKAILEKSIESGLVDAYGSGRGRSYMLSHRVYGDSKKSIGYVRQADIDETRYLELIVNLAQKNEYISRSAVVQLLHVPESKAYRLLKKLASENILTAVNKGRYAKYKFNRV